MRSEHYTEDRLRRQLEVPAALLSGELEGAGKCVAVRVHSLRLGGGGVKVPLGRSVKATRAGACKTKGGASPMATSLGEGAALVLGCACLSYAGTVPVPDSTGWARPRRISIVTFNAR